MKVDKLYKFKKKYDIHYNANASEDWFERDLVNSYFLIHHKVSAAIYLLAETSPTRTWPRFKIQL